MTATASPRLLPVRTDLRYEPTGVRRAPVVTPSWVWVPGLTLAAAIGTSLVGFSYRQSIVTGEPSYSAFWAGVLVFMVPVALFILRRSSRRGGLLAICAATGLFLDVPKILRSPFGPVYHDELAHWEQVQEIARSGHLFDPNTTIPIIQYFPGLHIVTLTVQDLTGLSTWSSAEVLLACFHVVDLLAVFLTVEGFTRSHRAGAIAALIYSLNASFMYFDTQFAYESLGIMLFLTTVAAAQRAERAPGLRARVGWSAVAILIGCSCAVTHHLSALCLCLLLLAWSLVTVLTRPRGALRRPVFAIAGCVVAFFAVWIVKVAPSTVAYLRPYLGNGLAQLAAFLGHGRGGRTLFGQGPGAGSVPVPHLEELAAFLSILIVLGGTATALFRLVRRRSRGRSATRVSAAWTTLFLSGLLYFPSIPLLLAPSGAEGARRSWAFSYLGIAVILAPMIARSLSRAVGLRRRGSALLLLAFVVVLIGNVAAGLDESYRFPGPYAVGSDARTQTPEVDALARWFRGTVGVGNKVISDRFTGLELGTYGRQLLDAPSAGFPTFELWLDRSAPSPLLVTELSSSDYRFLVIDTEMNLPVSQASGFFTYSGAASTDGTTTITAQDLARFASYGWLTRVYDSSDYAVYRFQFGSIGKAVYRS